MAMQLTLPRGLGCYHLGTPQLNYRIDIPEEMRLAAGKSFYRADLCYPNKRLILEYNSDEYHVGADRIASDARRLDVLAAMRWHVVTVTNRQLSSKRDMDLIAGSVAKTLGVRLRVRSTSFERRLDMFRDIVL